jgi:hypothetical protein
LPLTGADAAEIEDLGDLTVDAPLFWEGGESKDAVVFWELCDTMGPCWEYSFDVVESADYLRIALDYGERESRYAFRVRPPGDAAPVVFDPSRDISMDNFFVGPTTLEAAIPNPVLGRYEVMVAPVEVEDDSFRMRAILHNQVPQKRNPHAPAKPLLPNMVAVPPFKFTFVPPVSGFMHTTTPQRGVDGRSPTSCTEDERLDPGNPETCLRFGAGGFNLGDGALRVIFDADQLEGEAFQVIFKTDGTAEQRPAGGYVFHKEHHHFHYVGALDYQLFKVNDMETGDLERVGEGSKTGYCMVDYFIADWYATDQQIPSIDRQSAASNCGLPHNRPGELTGSADPVGYATSPYEGRIGWSKGWGDVYPNWRPGQYVNFTDQPDGYYVVTSVLDQFDRLEETDETDNSAYALVRVWTDDLGFRQVERIDWGRGESPWDPRAEKLTDRWM